MKPRTKRDQPKLKSKKAKEEASQQRTKSKPKAKRSRNKDPRKQAKEELETATTPPPTHYELGSRAPLRAASNELPSVLGATG
jgi:hypothetical protein